MKYGKLALIFCLVCTLLLAGCNKAPAETPDTPDTPATPAPPGSQGPSQPVTPPEPPATPLQPPLTEEEEALLEAALLREEMAELVQNTLTEGTFVMTAEPLEAYEHDWEIWGFRVKNGIRQPWRNIATITPDGKDYSLLLNDAEELSPAWVAIQNYRLLESDLTHGTGQLLNNLGFAVEYTGNVPEPTEILFTDFQAAMLRIVTPELYDSRFSDLFSEKDGKLQYQEVGATGALYLVDRLEQDEDGSWLSYEHTYHLNGSREDYVARVTLEELPDGRLVVAQWETLTDHQPAPQNEKK